MKEKELFSMSREGYLIKLFDLEDNPHVDWVFGRAANGMKGKVIIRHNDNKEIRFMVHAKKLILESNTKTILFRSRKTGKVVFSLSTPYVEDGGGAISNEAYYEVKSIDNSSVIVTIHWDTAWQRDMERVLPVSIHWKIKVPELTDISTYSKMGDDLIETPCHKIGWNSHEENEMFLQIKVPNLNKDDILDCAVLSLTHSNVFSADQNIYNILLFCIDSLQSINQGMLIDSVPLHYSWCLEYKENPTYSFDITQLLETSRIRGVSELFFKIKMERKAKGYENYVVFHGAASDVLLAPKMKISYQKRNNKNRIQRGDLISLKKGGYYVTGGCIPEWIRLQKWYVEKVDDDGVLLCHNEFGSRYDLPLVERNSVVFVARSSILYPFTEESE